MKIQLGLAMGQELCNMLGLDPSKVNDIVLHAPTNGYAWVECKIYVTQSDLNSLQLRRFKLVAFDSTETVPKNGLERQSKIDKPMDQLTDTESEMLTATQVSNMLGISQSLIYTQVRKKGHLLGVPAIRIGKTYRFNAAAIKRAIGKSK